MGESEPDWAATRRWVAGQLAAGERIVEVERLSGGITSDMRRLRVAGGSGERDLVLRSFSSEYFVEPAREMLEREAAAFTLLADDPAVPTPRLVALDATATWCDHPSLLMTALPGRVVFDPDGADERADALARQLVTIHRVVPDAARRPSVYRPWADPEHVERPTGTRRPDVWERAVDVLRAGPPAYDGCFLHRDFHPGNVLFDGASISGVVDWVESSWGPRDLDAAHCATNLALLYGVPAGLAFPERYRAAGGRLADRAADRRYWRLLDALGFAPDAHYVVPPWRAHGRDDLTVPLVARRLEDYIAALL